MLHKVIEQAVANRVLVLLLAGILAVLGWQAYRATSLDAIPDLSDTQVIIKTSFPGQSPQVVQDQVTYPLTTALLSVPGSTAVRGYSFYGDSYIYVTFKDGTDLYWARSRVLEYLNQARASLPAGVNPQLGPDATGVGWVYEYALTDPKGSMNLSQLTTLQNFFLKYQLQTVPGVAEVATVGGMVQEYQIVVDPNRLRAFGISLDALRQAVADANREVGGGVVELGGAEYMIISRGYLKSIADIERIPVGVNAQGTPVLVRDLATVRLGPAGRRGVADLNGQGEVVGGIIVMRQGENARRVITAVKQKLDHLKPSLPPGVEIVPVYDRSGVIDRAVATLQDKLLEEFLVVALVCLVFLWHWRSALVAIVSLPLGVLAAFIVMHAQGINANIMSLGGIAIAIGAMVDAAIVLIENLHRHLSDYQRTHGVPAAGAAHWQLVVKSSQEVGPALFFSLLIITLSFVPVFTLQAQEGRMFAPLAYTKTYAMAAAAGLAVTLVPVLMGLFIRGRLPDESKNPLTRALVAAYRPVLALALRWPKRLLLVALLILATTVLPFAGVGGYLAPMSWFGGDRWQLTVAQWQQAAETHWRTMLDRKSVV